MLDFGPWWYAPLLAMMIGGLILFPEAPNDLHVVAWGSIAAIAGGTITIHDHRRRSVRLRPSVRSAALLGLMAVICWALVAAWGTAISSIGYESFVPVYALLGWLLTTAVLLGIRAGLLALRRRRPTLQ